MDSLPEEALLEIFKFYVDDPQVRRIRVWHTLVHVCQRWRNVIFSSPRRLNLQLLCKSRRPVTEMVNIWPELPIIVLLLDHGKQRADGVENLIAALKLNHRISQIGLWDVRYSAVERFVTAMQAPFPALTELDFWSNKSDESCPVLSDEFLGGSAPRLQRLTLTGIPFPALPKLLLSTTDLVSLELNGVPHSGYISPDEMVACLSSLTRLDRLLLDFRTPLSRPSQGSRPPRPHTRSVLPALSRFRFKGVTEYLEDFVARIDTPLLRNFSITFFNQLMFGVVQLPMFLDRIDGFAVLDSAKVTLNPYDIELELSTRSQTVGTTWIHLSVSCSKLDRQLSSLSQVCASTLPTLPNLENLHISEHYTQYLQDDIENIQWLELLRPFSTVKNVYLSKQVVTRVAPALQELAGERVTEVLPALQVLSLELKPSGQVQEALREFVAARQHSGCPVVIRHGERNT
jgi:hypothetical protein